MILALKKNITPAREEALLAYLHQMGVTAAKETCRGCTVLLLEGAVESLDAQLLSSLPAVEAVLPLDEPLPLSSRAAHGADTVVRVGPALVGGGTSALWRAPAPWNPRRSSSPSPAASAPPGPWSFGAVPSSPAPPPTTSPACKRRA